MTTDEAKNYLSKREIPQLFESLMTGLMYYRPEDHIDYLQDCLKKIQQNGVDSVRWNLFIDQRRKTPLPPISGGNGRTQTPIMGERQSSFITARGTSPSMVGLDMTDHEATPDNQRGQSSTPLSASLMAHSTDIERPPSGENQVFGSRSDASSLQGAPPIAMSPKQALSKYNSPDVDHSQSSLKDAPELGVSRKSSGKKKKSAGTSRSRENSATSSASSLKDAPIIASRVDSPKNASPQAESPINGSPKAGSPTNQSPKAGSPTNQSPKAGSPTNQSPKAGSPTNQSPKAGSPTNQSPKAGSPTNQSPKAGSPTNQSPKAGSPTNGSLKAGSPRNASPKEGSPTIASPNADSPTNGSPKAGSPSNASPKAGSPNNASPKAGSPSYASPKAGSPTNASPKAGSPTNQSPKAESPTNQSPKAESPSHGSPKSGSPRNGSPKSGSPRNGSPKGGSPRNTSPKAESLTDASPKAGSPRNSSPKEENPEMENSHESVHEESTRPDSPPAGDAGRPASAQAEYDEEEKADDISEELKDLREPEDEDEKGVDLGTNGEDQTPAQGGSRSPVLPPIGQSGRSDGVDRVDVPQCPIVLVMGGPGSGKATQCKQLIERYQGWVHLSMGDLLRQHIFKKGSADEKWDMVGTLIRKGEMAPEDITIDLLKQTLAGCQNAKGIILEGYPRNQAQVNEIDRVIGRVDLVFVLDCEEHYLQQRLLARGRENESVDDNMKAIANRLQFFKEHTLPVIKLYDDQGKVVIVDGDRDGQEIFYDLCLLFDHTFYTGYGGKPSDVSQPRPPSGSKPRSPRPGSTRYSRPGSRASRPGSGFVNVPKSIELDVQESGRVAGLPTCPIMVVLGGPGTKDTRSDIAKRLVVTHPGSELVSAGQLLRESVMEAITEGNMAPDITVAELVSKRIQELKDAKGIILEGYPRNKAQVEAFYREIGGLTMVVLLDCEESYLRHQLRNKGTPEGRMTNKIQYFKYNVLPIMGHFDDENKLVVVNAEQDTEAVFKELKNELRKHMHAAGSPAASPAPVPEVLSIEVKDTGRLPGQPQGYIISVIGSPGSGINAQCRQIAEKYSFEHLKDLSSISSCVDAKGVVLEGYPSTKEEIENFNRTVGGMDCVVVIDCEEDFARDHAGSRVGDIPTYKSDTLPALGHYEDRSKLEYINGQKDADAVFADIVKVLNTLISRPRQESATPQPASQSPKAVSPVLQSPKAASPVPTPQSPRDATPEPAPQSPRAATPEPAPQSPKAASPAPPPESPKAASPTPASPRAESPKPADTTEELPPLPPLPEPFKLETRDTGRKDGFPMVPIVAVLGHTCDHCSKAAEQAGVLHLKPQSVSELAESMKNNPDAKGFLIEHFPANQGQLEEFNSTIGGMTGAVIVDASEEYLVGLGKDLDELIKVADDTFPLLAHYEDRSQLGYVNGEEAEDVVFASLMSEIKNLVHGTMNT